VTDIKLFSSDAVLETNLLVSRRLEDKKSLGRGLDKKVLVLVLRISRFFASNYDWMFREQLWSQI